MWPVLHLLRQIEMSGLEMKDIINNFSSTDTIQNDSKLVALFG